MYLHMCVPAHFHGDQTQGLSMQVNTLWLSYIPAMPGKASDAILETSLYCSQKAGAQISALSREAVPWS